LAVPVLAASASYALAEARKWPSGLCRQPFEAKAFYGAIVGATLAGIGINLSPIDPVKALFWSAVVNGVVAVPMMTMMMLITSNKTIMGRFTIDGGRRLRLVSDGVHGRGRSIHGSRGPLLRLWAACLIKYYKRRYWPTKLKRTGSNGSWNRSGAIVNEV
jgi:Mn2+/Fe2+ NRAMP family transporter